MKTPLDLRGFARVESLRELFGREGHVLPLGPAAQQTGELDPQRPIDEVWIFGDAPEETLPAGVRVRAFS